MDADFGLLISRLLSVFIRVHLFAAHKAVCLADEKSGRGKLAVCPRSNIRRLYEATQEVKART